MSVRRLDPVQPDSFTFNPDNLAWAKKNIAQYPEGKQASAVIALLFRAQEQCNGWLPKPAMELVADMLGMSYIRVYEVATFYTMFQLSPVGSKAHIQVCGTTPCMLRGAENLKKVCQSKIHQEPHHLNVDGTLSWEEVECLGACVNAPLIQVFKDTYEDLTPEKLDALIDDLAAGRAVKPGPQNGRHFSMPEGTQTTLTDPSLYSGTRKFTRIEAPPPPPPAPPAGAAPAPAAAPKPVAPAPVVAAPVAPKPVTTIIPPPAPVAAPVASRVVETVRAATAPMVRKVEPTRVVSAAPRVVEPSRNVSSPASTVTRNVVSAAEAKLKKVEKTGGPELLRKPRSGKGDDLKDIVGVGPVLEKMLNGMGVWHFDQIASWTAKDLAWVDERLEGFKGRAKRDEWVKQAKQLAKGKGK